jgi:hypothetical protein
VAFRTARKAKAQAARRRMKEAQVWTDVAVEDSDDLVWRDLRPVLDESVNGLPEKYRLPFVLHYLQGISVTEIARRLCCPRGSVAVRLARARERLRARLVRRGLTLSAGCLLTALSEASATASVPASMVVPTAKAAALVATGPSFFSACIAGLMEGVLRIMRTVKGKVAVGVLFVAALFGAGAGMSTHREKATKPEDAKDATKAKAPASVGGRRDKTSRNPRIRFLSLAEARTIALEQGDTSQPALFEADSIRVLADSPAGIVVCGIPQDGHQLERELRINQMLLNVETAYWNLYGSYWQLYSREQALRLAYEACKIVAAKYKTGRASLADFTQAERQYNLFRSQRLQAIDNLLDNERQLRAMLGLPAPKQTGYELFPAQPLQADDAALDSKGRMWISSGKQIEEVGTRLVPSDAPTAVEKKPPDWEKSLAETLKNRPELRLARQDVQLAKEDKLAKKGSPEQHQAQLQLDRAYLVLQDQELKAERFLGLMYRRMSSSYSQVKAARAQQEEFARQLRVRTEKYRAGAQDASFVLLEAQRFWADALATEYQAIVTYNNALCGLEFVKGAIMAHAHVRLAEEPPSDEEEVFAVQRERKRTLSKVRREPAAPKTDGDTDRQRPTVAFSLPSLWKTTSPLKKAEELPPVEKGIDAEKWLRELAALE